MAKTLFLDCVGRSLDLSRPRVMGILNVTPDSFSDGGLFANAAAAFDQAARMVEQGADIIDVGGESTRPGADAVSVQEELDRVLPVIERVSAQFQVPVSIDTSKPEVMNAAVKAGAGLINDVNGLRAAGALDAAVRSGVPVCLMHMQGEPRTMQQAPSYTDVVDDVATFLQSRIDACTQAGLPMARLLIDPGFGFGKTLAHNLALLQRLDRIVQLGVPVLVGISRKSMLGTITGRSTEERLSGSLAAAVIAAERGARILRVHDVAETVDALKVWTAVAEQGLDD